MSIIRRFMLSAVFVGCVIGAYGAAKETGFQKITGFRVPHLGAFDSKVYLVWDAPSDSASVEKNAPVDYALFVNGKRLSETASQNYARVNPMTSLYRDSFYNYYTKKRVGFDMVRVSPTSFCADSLSPETTYTFRVASLNKKGKIIAESEEITVTTLSAPVVVSIADFGAKAVAVIPTDEAEIKSLAEQNAVAIQKAIVACPDYGVVLVPRGTFLTAPFRLKSHMTLQVDGEILSTPFAEQYEFGFLLYPYRTDKRYYGLINVDGAEEIRITGSGAIDGNGWVYMSADGKKLSRDVQYYSEEGDPDFDKLKLADKDSFRLRKYRHSNAKEVFRDGILSASACAQVLGMSGKTPETATDKEKKAAYGARSTMLLLRNVKGLFVTGVTFRNPSNHTLNILDSENISVTGIREMTYDCNNGDGIGLIHSKNAILWNNFIDTGDDSIVFSAGVGEPAFTSGEQAVTNIRIFGNYIHHGHGGVSFGSHTAMGMSDVHVFGNVFSHTDVPFRCKSNAVTGGGAFDVLFENNAIAEANQAFLITTSYDNESSGTALGAVFHDMTIRNCTVYGVGMNTICLESDRHFPAYNLHFSDISFAEVGRGVNTIGWEALVNLRDSSFKNIRFVSYTDKAKAKKRDKSWVNMVHCENVTFDQK
ncbi:MAG: hypothetical protein IJS09_04350 [Treponema sp.]|nr:hypothetical protein [Treponema sp.]